jgi:hypothetical protein
MEKKWRDENERIMREHPLLPGHDDAPDFDHPSMAPPVYPDTEMMPLEPRIRGCRSATRAPLRQRARRNPLERSRRDPRAPDGPSGRAAGAADQVRPSPVAGLCRLLLLCRADFSFLVQPLVRAFGPGRGRLVYTKLYEAFFVEVRVAFFAAFFIAFPVIATQIWAFVAPGLYTKEKRAFLPFLVATPSFSRSAERSLIMW